MKIMEEMFREASSFNSDSISNWNTSSVTNMFGMFFRATSFNQDLFWDTSSVTNMGYMFSRAASFNSSSILNWNVSKVTRMNQMFKGATDFAQNLCLWKDAPAVQTRNTFEMFTGSSGQPNLNDGSGRFNSAAC